MENTNIIISTYTKGEGRPMDNITIYLVLSTGGFSSNLLDWVFTLKQFAQMCVTNFQPRVRTSWGWPRAKKAEAIMKKLW